jgi:hypothetical protein
MHTSFLSAFIAGSLLVGCSHSSAPKTTAETTAPGSAAATTVEAKPASFASVEVVYGLMTFVMDSPGGQRDKAEAAVKGSNLGADLQALGLTVSYRFDKAKAGDDVLVVAPDGSIIARGPLMDFDDKIAPPKIAADVKARLQAK